MITVKPSDFRDAAKKMDDAANRIDMALQCIDTEMENLDSVWHDANSRKYLNQYRELQKFFPDFKMSLHNYSSFLTSLLEIYQKEFTEAVSEDIK